MYQIDFNKPEHIHFIGIGGISMSGLAEILLERGFTISGSSGSQLCDCDILRESYDGTGPGKRNKERF